MNKEPIISVTSKDLKWVFTKGSGAGGQKRNKTSSAVHCIHEPSGSAGYSEAQRSQLMNRKDAFRKMAESQKFQTWIKLETAKKLGQIKDINETIDELMQDRYIKTEVKEDGKWVPLDF